MEQSHSKNVVYINMPTTVAPVVILVVGIVLAIIFFPIGIIAGAPLVVWGSVWWSLRIIKISRMKHNGRPSAFALIRAIFAMIPAAVILVFLYLLLEDTGVINRISIIYF